MLGAIIGDIVGSRFEFNNYRAKDFKLFTSRCKATDDSIMTLAVSKAIMETEKIKQLSIEGYSYDSEYYGLLAKMAVKYMREIGRRYPHCGYGGKFAQWMFGDSPDPYNSFGNGAAMRISPVGFIARTESEVRELSEAITGTTHNHAEGIKGAEAVSVAVFMALRGSTKDDIRDKINSRYYPLDFTIDGIRGAYAFNETCQETVPQAIEAFLESSSFEDAIRIAVSVGGDSDTLAAITGAIAEAYYGVPEKIKDKALKYLDNNLCAIFDEWTAFIGNGSLIESFNVLTKYIGKISKTASYGNWVIDGENDGTPEHPIHLPFVNFHKLVNAFVSELYQLSGIHPEYQLTNYNSILESNGLKWDAEVMRKANADKLDAKCILALIMGAIRAEHFCDGALLKFFQDGNMLKWLKRLKDIDGNGKNKMVEGVYFEAGGFGGYDIYRIIFSENDAVVTRTLRNEKTSEERYSGPDAIQLRNRFAVLHVEYWNSEYTDSRVCDGEQWMLSVKYCGRREMAWVGNNDYPPNWDEVLNFFKIRCEDEDEDEVRIKKLVIEFDRNHHFEAKGIDKGVNWHYTESMTIDHEKEQLILKQNIGSGCVVTHQYDVQGGMDSILIAADECLQCGGWIDTPKYQDDTGVRFYKLTAEYYDNTLVTHAGIYNRKGIPDEPWTGLIDTILNFIGFYGLGELLDEQSFLNAGKTGEIKYCSVAFEKYGQTYYYQTDNEDIEVGDSVIVPCGGSNTERKGTVEEIGYYRTDNVPFPLEKTKSIISKIN